MHRVQEGGRIVAGKHHRQEHRDVCAKQQLRQAEDRLTPPYPRRRNYPLSSLVAFVASLGGFVLHAPLADLLPERQGRKLPTASNTVRHVLYYETTKGTKLHGGRLSRPAR